MSRGIVLSFSLLTLLAGLYGLGKYSNHKEQSAAFDAAMRHIESAESIDSIDSKATYLKSAIRALKAVEEGHPKYSDAQKLLTEHQADLDLIAQESEPTREDLLKALAAYGQFIKQIDPNAFNVSSVNLDPRVDTRVVVVVGSGWANASETAKKDLANVLWKNWGQMCGCVSPRIQFKSQSGRDLGGTVAFGTAIELKD